MVEKYGIELGKVSGGANTEAIHDATTSEYVDHDEVLGVFEEFRISLQTHSSNKCDLTFFCITFGFSRDGVAHFGVVMF